MSRARIHVYLGDDYRRVQREAKLRGVSVSRLAHAALLALLDVDEDKREALIQRRFDRITRQATKLDRDISILNETIALFIQYQLTITPPIPVTDQEAVKAQAKERYANFIERVATRVTEGRRLVDEVIEEITPAEEDFFNIDLSEVSHGD